MSTETIAPRVGDWMQTFSGRQFWPADPRVEEIDIADIAHALAHQCRFAGHCRRFYSVAEHSVRVSWVVARKDALWGLLHDASEAYLVDLPRPLKNSGALGAEYRGIEERLMACVCTKWGLAPTMPPAVRVADDRMLFTEARDLLAPAPSPWGGKVEPLKGRIMPWDAVLAEEMFLKRFEDLRGKD